MNNYSIICFRYGTLYFLKKMEWIAIGVGSMVVGAASTYFFTRDSGNTHNDARVEAQGAINNVVITDVQDRVEIESSEILILLSIICGIKVIEFLYFIYNQHVGGIKRKYERRQVQNATNPA